MRFRNLLAVAVPAVTALAVTACSPQQSTTGISVVASFYPAAFLAERIGGDEIHVSTLTKPGVEPHDLELTAKQVIEINEADVVVYLADFQSAVDHGVNEAHRDAGTTVDIGLHVTRLNAGDEAHEDHADHEDHEDGGTDPHVWLDPDTMIAAVPLVTQALVTADPAHRTTFEANAATLIDDLTALAADGTARLGAGSCARKEFVTSHAAFAYLARHFGLTQISISGVDPSAEPSTAALAKITELVKSHGITTIFTERIASSALATTVARETGATTAVLDPIEGLTTETSTADYLSLMHANIDALALANGCAS